MRIIAGQLRGRTILAPKSDATRPVTDRVKQSVFDILTPLLEGANVFDCFAGTGSMGLECLSRGASKAWFFEQDRSALTLLKGNIEALGLSDQSQIVPGDLFKWFGGRHPFAQADLVFLDPPYRFLQERSSDLQNLVGHWRQGYLLPNATLVFRHDTNDQLSLPEWIKFDERSYGGMTVEFLRPQP